VIAWVASTRKVLPVLPGRRVHISFVGIHARAGRVVAVAIWGHRNRQGKRPSLRRIYTLCTKDGVGQFNVPGH
jgi:hypothetical protein